MSLTIALALMNDSTRWRLDPDSFLALLAALHEDKEEASRRYEALHQRLTRFFGWNHALDPESLADETLDRLAKRIQEDNASGAPASRRDSPVQDPVRFAAGIARLLLHESWRQQQREERAYSQLERSSVPGSSSREDEDLLAEDLEHCLASLPASSRTLIERYYSTEARTMIAARKQLAVALGVSRNALRNRALRIRADLEACARQRNEQRSRKMESPQSTLQSKHTKPNERQK